MLVSEVTDEGKVYACAAKDGPALEKLMDTLREEFSANPPVRLNSILLSKNYKVYSIPLYKVRILSQLIVTVLLSQLAGAYQPKKNDTCAAKFVDDQWYRAKEPTCHLLNLFSSHSILFPMVNSRVVDLAFHFNADTDPAFYYSTNPGIRIQLFTLMRIRILLVVNGMGIFDHWSLDHPGLHF